ncbi:hypothetical protein ADEAN_000452500 [Angomonas deanei]|uniref:Uncharacterized protein n=1 Tax=Angomonas deanei TaxID=59799 RepID=A0A7G2CDM0_9TRYP|nr:hypothetical protein ADEAN_000452500 [Angomonas deanei]
MISCSAIQKLERYGLLGLKKKNTREYIQFSLNDEKRSNIYALTNLPTWEEALEAIARTHQQVSTGQQEGMAAATTSDSLLYAMSFSASLIAHHVHTVLLGTPSNIFDSQGDAGKDHIEFSLNMVKVLELIAVQLSASTANSTSASFVEGNFSVKALGHLLHSVLDVLMNSSVLLFAASSKLLKGKQDMKCFGEICTRAYIFTGAVIRLLHRTCSFSKTHSGNSTRELFSSKSCSSYLKQTQAKSTNASKQDAPSALVTEAIAEARPALSLLYTILSSCEKSDKSAIPFTFVSELVLLHKLALFHELCNAMPELLSQIPSGDSQSPASFAELQQSASMLLTSTCGSKATCYVLYYRGDDVKLLQNNINDMDEYSLYTYATSAPIEASLLQRVKDAFAANRFDEATLKCALAMLCWVCASPLIFRSFCYSDNWHVFAQEQRRKVLQYQANSRNALKSYNSKRSASEEKLTEKKEAGDGDNDTSSVHSHASSVGGAGSVNTNANSLSSYHTDMSSMISLSSRLSLLSSFSRHSTDTYLSFMSVLGPTQTNADWMATKYSHESEDGNTNLPLIFLEEIVLALQRFNEAISFTGGLFDSLYDCVVWKSVESLFLTVNHSSDRHEQNYSKEVRVPIFDFGNDVRYNNGRGFEILGLVFAKVIAPCLVEDGTVHKTSTIVESLSVCLSSYEFVAPHIIDQNLGIIVKLLCTSFRHAGDLLSLNESLVVNFFLNVISRLGKNNQLPLLLDVLLPKAVEESGEATSPLDENDERALVGVFSAGVVQSVYTTAVKYSFDQESLMKLFVDYVTANSVDSAVETLVHPTFVITLTVLTLRGMVPTSVSSTSILERATELELILCNAFTKLSAEFRKKEHQQGKEVEFSQLLCLTLWSIYECRRTTTECLQDLGLQNLKEYVQMLENMMWNTQTQLLQVVGDLSFDAVGQFAKAVGDSSVREAATTVILKLCIQRLVLAQNVFRLEGSADIAGQFKEDARTLSAFVLDQMRGESNADNATNDSRDALLFFVATVNENEWESLTVFSRSKSFREFCLFTIRQMFLQEVGNSHFLQWFNRILRAAPSYILRAITDVMLDIGSSTVLKFANGHEKDGDAAHIPSLLKALEICYLRVGHNPYWPTVLLCISKWCLPLKSQASAECKTALERLIRIVNLIVSSERNSHGVFRYVLSGEHGKPAGNSTLKPLYVEAIGVPRALLVEIGKDSSLWNEKTALGDWSFEDEIKTVNRQLVLEAVFGGFGGVGGGQRWTGGGCERAYGNA